MKNTMMVSFVIFVCLIVLCMFNPVITLANLPTCSLSLGNYIISSGQSVTVNYEWNDYGTGAQRVGWIGRQDNGLISGATLYYSDYFVGNLSNFSLPYSESGHTQNRYYIVSCPATSPASSCPNSLVLNNLPPGTYHLWCKMETYDDNSCNGNPLCSYRGGWITGCNRSCGNDLTSLTVLGSSSQVAISNFRQVISQFVNIFNYSLTVGNFGQ